MGPFRQEVERFIGKFQVDAVGAEIEFLPQHHGAEAVLEYVEEPVHRELVEDHVDGKPADEFRLETEVHQVLGREFFQQVLLVGCRDSALLEADPLHVQPLSNHVLEPVERSRHDEEDVPGVDLVARNLSGALGFHGRFHLGREVVGRLQIDLGLFHELQEVPLDAGARHVGPVHVSGRGDLVNFVQVDDTVLGLLHVAVRLVDQVPHQVFERRPPRSPFH